LLLALTMLGIGVQGCQQNVHDKLRSGTDTSEGYRRNVTSKDKPDGQDQINSFCKRVFGDIRTKTIDISDMYERPASDYPGVLTAKARPVLISFVRCWKRMYLDIDGQYFKVLNTHYPELSALQAAALTGKLRAVRILILAGADVNFGFPDSSVLDYAKQLAVFDQEFGVKESVRQQIISELTAHGAKSTWED